jgi:hypothetical protein
MTRLVTPQQWNAAPLNLISIFFRLSLHFFFDFHVPELVGVEYLATIQTFDVFDVLFACYHAYLRVFAGGVHWES